MKEGFMRKSTDNQAEITADDQMYKIFSMAKFGLLRYPSIGNGSLQVLGSKKVSND
jgi:hypothetical protein